MFRVSRNVGYYVIHIRSVVSQGISVKDCRRDQLEKGMSWVDVARQVEAQCGSERGRSVVYMASVSKGGE